MSSKQSVCAKASCKINSRKNPKTSDPAPKQERCWGSYLGVSMSSKRGLQWNERVDSAPRVRRLQCNATQCKHSKTEKASNAVTQAGKTKQNRTKETGQSVNDVNRSIILRPPRRHLRLRLRHKRKQARDYDGLPILTSPPLPITTPCASSSPSPSPYALSRSCSTSASASRS